MKSKLRLNHILLFIFFILLSVGFTASYYTDHHSIVNEFTVGKVQIELTEKIYDQEKNIHGGTSVSPGEKFKKDPAVKNTGKSDCFVFVEVTIPKSERIFTDNAGQKLPVMSREVFSYTVNPGWSLIDETISETSAKRVYAFTEGSYLKPLRPGEEQLVVKDGVFFSADYIETELSENFYVPVICYAIETTDLINTDGDNNEGCMEPLQVFKVIRNQIMSEEVSRSRISPCSCFASEKM